LPETDGAVNVESGNGDGDNTPKGGGGEGKAEDSKDQNQQVPWDPKAWEGIQDLIDNQAQEHPSRHFDEQDMLAPGVIAIPKVDADAGTARRAQEGSPGTGGGSGGGNGTGTGTGTGSGLGSDGGRGIKTDRFPNGVNVRMEDLIAEHQEDPYYPMVRGAYIQGDVVVTILISERGIPIKTDLEASVSEILTAEVLKVIPRWKFKPFKVEGHATKARFKMTFRFSVASIRVSGLRPEDNISPDGGLNVYRGESAPRNARTQGNRFIYLIRPR
jgi:TonB family protein